MGRITVVVMREDLKNQKERAEYDSWFRRQVQAGLDSAKAGKLIPAEEVEAKFAKRRADTLEKLGHSDRKGPQ
jgi:predicted transcriptional regulator